MIYDREHAYIQVLWEQQFLELSLVLLLVEVIHHTWKSYLLISGLWFFHTTGFLKNAFLTTAGNFGGQIIGDTIDGKEIDYEAAVASTVAGLTVSGATSKLFRTTSSGKCMLRMYLYYH